MHTDDAMGAHHPFYPLVIDAQAAIAQLCGDARAAVGAVELRVNRPDPPREFGIRLCAGRPHLRGGTPPVEPRAGNGKDTAQSLHAEGAGVVGDELEATHQLVSPAKYLAARRRMSRSSSSSRIRALSCLFSSSTSSEGIGAFERFGIGLALAGAVPAAWAWRTHNRSVSRLIPRSRAT